MSEYKPNDPKFWLGEIDSARKSEREWRDVSSKIIKIYRQSDSEDQTIYFNILNANVSVLLPAIFGGMPEPIVSRRLKSADKNVRKVAGVACKIQEDILAFNISDPETKHHCKMILLDYLLTGRGVGRVEYVPINRDVEEWTNITNKDEIEKLRKSKRLPRNVRKIQSSIDGEQFERSSKTEELVSEEIKLRHTHWADFNHSVSEFWDDVWWISFRSKLTRVDIEEEYGKRIAKEVSFEKEERNDGRKEEGAKKSELPDTVNVYQIWNKRDRKVRVVAEGYEDFLDERDDPLGLQDFFPMRKPLYGIEVPGRLVPVPEYLLYQDKAEQLNKIQLRKANLLDALKVRGGYDAAMAWLKDIFEGDENEVKPVENWSQVAAAGGLKGCFDLIDIVPYAEALRMLSSEEEDVKRDIFEITGISDIIRGSTDPRETAHAQELKSNFGSLRLQPRQNDVNQFFADCYSVMSEAVAENFDLETITLITGNFTDERNYAAAHQMLQSDEMREFNIDVETGDTIFIQDKNDKQESIEFVTAVSTFIHNVMPAAQAGMMPPQAAAEIVKFLARKFRISRDIEMIIDNATKAAQAAPQQQDPAAQAQMLKAQNERMRLQLESKKAEMDMRVAEMDYDIEMKKLFLKAEEMNVDLQTSMIKADSEIRKATIASKSKDGAN